MKWFEPTAAGLLNPWVISTLFILILVLALPLLNCDSASWYSVELLEFVEKARSLDMSVVAVAGVG